MKLIALTGAAGCGKDTFADYLVHKHGYTKLTFANNMKMGAQKMLGLSDEQVWGDAKDEPIWDTDITTRKILQTLGTDWGRNMIDPSIWILMLDKKLSNMKADGYKLDKVVISDMRFDNEAEWVRSKGGTVVKIVRDAKNRASDPSHPSEGGVSNHNLDCVFRAPNCVGPHKVPLYLAIEKLLVDIEMFSSNDGLTDVAKVFDSIFRKHGKPVFPMAYNGSSRCTLTSMLGNMEFETVLLPATAPHEVRNKAAIPRDMKYGVTVESLQENIRLWADGVFPERTIKDAISKMVLEEIPEYLMNQSDRLELADIGILLYDIANLAGVDLNKAILEKMDINRERKWEIDPDTGMMNHVKEGQ